MDSKPRLIAVIIATLVVQAGVYGGFTFYAQQLKRAGERERQAQHSQWTAEDQQREQAHQQAVGAKFGVSPVDRAVNDPGVDILGVLKVLAGQGLPKAAVATAGVDRFTEFSIYLKVISQPTAEQRAAYLRQILTRINPAYVFQVAFVEEAGPTIAAEQSCLLQINDWARASDATIARTCF
jgi:hypothetical protein